VAFKHEFRYAAAIIAIVMICLIAHCDFK
jgi:hypothetical protein